MCPNRLRRQLIETTNSENSGMIVIADRAGKEQWTEIVAHREAQHARSAARKPDAAAKFATNTGSAASRGSPGSSWAGVLLFLAAGALIASVFQFQVFHFGNRLPRGSCAGE
jgi:hypothetical protein